MKNNLTKNAVSEILSQLIELEVLTGNRNNIGSYVDKQILCGNSTIQVCLRAKVFVSKRPEISLTIKVSWGYDKHFHFHTVMKKARPRKGF